jgi:hypothetical protein
MTMERFEMIGRKNGKKGTTKSNNHKPDNKFVKATTHKNKN